LKIGVFDSGLGGLTVVDAIVQTFSGAKIYYIADTKEAPYGAKSKEQIKKHSIDIVNHLVDNHNIDALIVACNTATSAAISELRECFSDLILIGTEPGVKPAILLSKSSKVGVLATEATLKGQKYQELADRLSNYHSVKLYEQACPGLVEQIELGKVDDEKTSDMLTKWLTPMSENGVDTIVLGCTHYPLVSNLIKKIMGEDTILIETGYAISNRLKELSKDRQLLDDKDMEVLVYSTGDINKQMIDMILPSWIDGGKVIINDKG
jgi:glutamate racemase